MKRFIANRYYRAEGRLNLIRYRFAACEQKSNLSRKYSRHRGFAFVWTAIVIMALFLLVGLSIDWAKLLYNLHELQNAADAAALAGAQIIKVKTANETRLWSQEMASENTAEKLDVYLRTTPQDDPFTDETDLDIILGRWINHMRYFFPTLDTPDAVKVIARRAEGLTDAPALAFLYGPMVGVNTADANRVAIGWYNEIEGAGLIVLDPSPEVNGLFIASNVGEISVIGGSIHVNSMAIGTKRNNAPPAAVYVSSGGTMLCSRLTVQGHADPAPGSSFWEGIWTNDDLGMQMPYDIWEGAPYMPDPLEYLVPPSYGDYTVRDYNESSDGSVTLDPGYYPNGISITRTGTTVTLNPGTYILGGGNPEGNQHNGLIQTGGTLIGHGVLLYLTKDFINPDGKWAQLNIGGNVVTDIFPPGDLPENWVNGKPAIHGLPGVSIWQDRLNTDIQAQLHGGAGMMISGTLYFPKNHVYLAGNPGKAGNQMLCWTCEVFGNAQILIEYDGRNNQNKGVSVLVK